MEFGCSPADMKREHSRSVCDDRTEHPRDSNIREIDDQLIASPDLAPHRPHVGLQPRLSDAELVTLAVLSALLGFTSERRRPR